MVKKIKVLETDAMSESTEAVAAVSESIETQATEVITVAEPVSIGNPDEVLNAIAKNYEGFDPMAHAVNPDGSPRMKSTGGFAAKRGRKPGQTSAAATSGKRITQVAMLTGPDVSAQNEATAKLCANILINGGVQVFGDHWKPSDKNEADGLKCAFKDYFDSIGGVNLPPSVALLIAVGMYSAPRVMHPDSQAKIQGWTRAMKKVAL